MKRFGLLDEGQRFFTGSGRDNFLPIEIGKVIADEAEVACESTGVVAHARALFFHNLQIRSQGHGSVFTVPCDARFGHDCWS
jgi:hypothetical protein